VLNAFQNVADALTALEQDAAGERAAAASAKAAERSFTVARRQVALGALGGSGLLLAEQGYQTALAHEVAARTSRFADTAALFLALGGSLPEDESRAP